jgi:predicted ribosomally synthesized peptide with nif11-like leader
MSQQQAEAFIARVQEDPEFAERLTALKDDPTAVHALVVAEGFDATPEEIREAFVEAFGAELSEEQLAAIAGGMSDLEIGLTVGAVAAAPAIAKAVAVAAAAF